MILDTFMDDASEGIMQNPVPELADLQLECAVSLEAAYNDMVLETCQLKYQAMVEGVGVIHEGVIESIKNFFKAIFRAIQKFFGGGSGGSGGGGSSRNAAMLKKQLQDKRIKEGLQYLIDHPELLDGDEFKIPDEDTFVRIEKDDIERGLQAAMNGAQMAVQMGNVANNADGSKAAIDGDEIALNALRVFVKSAFASYNVIAAAKIDSLADFKKALTDHTKIMTPSTLDMDEIQSYQTIVDGIDKMNQTMQTQKIIMKKEMEAFQKKTINEVPPEYANLACKVAKTLTNAAMIYFSYACRVLDRMCEVIRKIFDMAKKINTKTN